MYWKNLVATEVYRKVRAIVQDRMLNMLLPRGALPPRDLARAQARAEGMGLVLALIESLQAAGDATDEAVGQLAETAFYFDEQ